MQNNGLNEVIQTIVERHYHHQIVAMAVTILDVNGKVMSIINFPVNVSPVTMLGCIEVLKDGALKICIKDQENKLPPIPE